MASKRGRTSCSNGTPISMITHVVQCKAKRTKTQLNDLTNLTKSVFFLVCSFSDYRDVHILTLVEKHLYKFAFEFILTNFFFTFCESLTSRSYFHKIEKLKYLGEQSPSILPNNLKELSMVNICCSLKEIRKYLSSFQIVPTTLRVLTAPQTCVTISDIARFCMLETLDVRRILKIRKTTTTLLPLSMKVLSVQFLEKDFTSQNLADFVAVLPQTLVTLNMWNEHYNLEEDPPFVFPHSLQNLKFFSCFALKLDCLAPNLKTFEVRFSRGKTNFPDSIEVIKGFELHHLGGALPNLTNLDVRDVYPKPLQVSFFKNLISLKMTLDDYFFVNHSSFEDQVQANFFSYLRSATRLTSLTIIKNPSFRPGGSLAAEFLPSSLTSLELDGISFSGCNSPNLLNLKVF